MQDTALQALITAEIKRQNETLSLIASENIADETILKIVGSPLANKYSEGYPGRRYYPGNKIIDQIETLAQERALGAFGVKGVYQANVQPYSGSPANLAVYLGLLGKAGGVLGLALDQGGHLTHGHKVSATGTYYESFSYGVTPSGQIDYEKIGQILKTNPQIKLVVSGTTAYPRQIDFKRIQTLCQEAGVYHLADISHIAGLVATGLYPNPFEAGADVVMTTTHKTIPGPRGAAIFFKPELADKINKAVFPGLQGGPHDNTIAAIAYIFGQVSTPEFKKYQNQVLINAKTLAQNLIAQGLELYTGGTDCHLLILRAPNQDGMLFEKNLEAIGLIANRNSLPGDPSPFKPSGVRLGTPSITTRGLKEKEVEVLGQIIGQVHAGEYNADGLKLKVLNLARKFPAYR
ncbi:MAG: serine hydroxymethyltransferase [Candidatus Yanofskybacteria bacterium CG10_big_fil_rev_8_21_14_0_10_46_23]|uniref:Serine hydroxymethyltransferase n=1 Tax=Candidatus Yanofskybacteria bacterium CG10_big_fil_rev_8_21_14_0_10_46_23 TaxID=1975098 RepID=A0A2H0R583_9BACT|nr:MAG: serine hydroxymethyltransferase [Candidatus Yanofskybacteria bacterium CG10_big_fil_rev_8_21_14_0_10_46_23]